MMKKMDEKEILPIGSVVLLEGGTKKLMNESFKKVITKVREATDQALRELKEEKAETEEAEEK